MPFVRAIGRWTLTALVVNSIVGASIFGLPSELNRLLGRASPIAMLVAALIVSTIVACMAEVASQFSRSGGGYVYVRTAFGRFAGLQVGYSRALISLEKWPRVEIDNRVVRLYEEQFSSGDLLMRWSKRCITAILLAGTPLLAQTSASSSAVNSSAVSAAEEPAKTAASPLALGSVEILTDTQGINFDSYLSRVLQDVRQHWFERIQEPPRTKRGNVVLDFAILEDGSVAGLRIIKTSGRRRTRYSGTGQYQCIKSIPPIREVKGAREDLAGDLAR